MYKLLNFLFGWDYVAIEWGDGFIVRRVHHGGRSADFKNGDKVRFIWTFDDTAIILSETNKRVVWLT